MWFYRSAFLCNDVGDWPNQGDFLHDVMIDELEVKNEHCFAQLREPNDFCIDCFDGTRTFKIFRVWYRSYFDTKKILFFPIPKKIYFNKILFNECLCQRRISYSGKT